MRFSRNVFLTFSKLLFVNKEENESFAEDIQALLLTFLQMISNDDFDESDKEFMDKAFHYAVEALKDQEVPVGCIFIHDNKIIAVGSNKVNLTKNATRHAEINCIDDINEYCKRENLDVKEFFKDISIYVTVEPCIMCMSALINLQVRKICYGCHNDRFGGGSVFNVSQVMNNTKTLIKKGYQAEEAMNLLKEFYNGTNPNAPLSKVKIKKCPTS